MKQSLQTFLFIFAGALCLMLAACWNGFPLAYSDTATYLASGFQLETPFDRPITYGIFMRLASVNGISLWFVIFFQSLILSALVFSLVKCVSGERNFRRNGMIIVALLSLFTGVSWTASQLIPDIFTSIALLTMSLIFLGKFSRAATIGLHFLFLFAVATHISHLPLFLIVLLLLFIFRRYALPADRYPDRNKKFATIAVLVLLSFFTMSSAISKSSHVFFMGAMVEHGITKAYLDENCDAHPYKLCAYKDSFPARAFDFVWNAKSPLYKVGGWSGSKKEFKEIINGTLSDPKFIRLHLEASVQATAEQLTKFRINDGNFAFADTSQVARRIAAYFPAEEKLFLTSKQNRDQLGMTSAMNTIFTIVVLLSVTGIIVMLLVNKTLFRGELKSLAFFFVAGILVNAWDCGTFANAIDRLGCKMIWLLPFLAMMMVGKIFERTSKRSS